MGAFRPFFLAQNGHVMKRFTGGFGERNVHQQGRLRHELTNKHGVCQTLKPIILVTIESILGITGIIKKP
ncbi:hypothetical protein SAMN04488700_1635 [Carnobacterium iners]|uniref:Uncharacterized protein n=1 Tax=Carnobacterium iners TaxID=1073423 RepID=A0A1X7NB12_9LACT|nr:hypothetical protein [Carnobacterium iners]SEL34757.1 hypothetical protein SAMN04488114_1577 [Carnobacterium iners]SMH34113.1 hypothetical protein SAMN04488700_1635 [Carnobacterium iners]